MQVLVRDNNVDQALRALKKKMQREGIFREMKLRGHYEKPSEKKAREKAEAVRRARKLIRKRMQREGLLPSKPRPTTAGPLSSSRAIGWTIGCESAPVCVSGALFACLAPLPGDRAEPADFSLRPRLFDALFHGC